MSFEKNVLLFPTIGYLDPKYKNCKINGNCNEAYCFLDDLMALAGNQFHE